jgi:hypothetical protein
MGRQSRAEKCKTGDERNTLHFLNDRLGFDFYIGLAGFEPTTS